MVKLTVLMVKMRTGERRNDGRTDGRTDGRKTDVTPLRPGRMRWFPPLRSSHGIAEIKLH